MKWALTTLVAVLAMQASWMLAMPPFHAMDEFDHVYRAAGVASGQWRLSEDTPNGRGLAVVVPSGLVDGAAAQCKALPYTGPDNCSAISGQGERVVVATAAGSYNPFFYWVIGKAGAPFEGDAANYAMRFASAIFNAMAIAFAAYCIGHFGSWTRLGFAVSLTPTLIYATIIPAPNALEIAAGLCLWSSLLVIFLQPMSSRKRSWLISTAALSASLLVTPRMLGPMWLALVVMVAVGFIGIRRVVAVVRVQHRTWLVATVVVVASALAAVWWTISASLTTAPLEQTADGPNPLPNLATESIAWMLGVIGAFPFPNQPAPVPAFALFLVVFLPLLWAALRVGEPRQRASLTGALLSSLLVPLAITVLTAAEHGAIWQGRYGLPFMIGIPLLCGVVLDSGDFLATERRRLVGLSLLALGAVHAACVVHVHGFEMDRVLEVPSPAWPQVSPLVVAVLASVGWVLLASTDRSLQRHGGRRDGSDVETVRI